MRRERMMNDDEFQEKISFDRMGERRGSNGVSLGTDQPRGTSALKAEENTTQHSTHHTITNIRETWMQRISGASMGPPLTAEKARMVPKKLRDQAQRSRYPATAPQLGPQSVVPGRTRRPL